MEQAEDLPAIFEVIRLQARLDPPAQQYGICAFLFQVLLRQNPHQSVVAFLGLIFWCALSKPYSEEVLVADIEAHAVLEASREVVEVFQLCNGYCGMNHPNYVTAARRTEVVDELPTDVRDDVADVLFLFLAAGACRRPGSGFLDGRFGVLMIFNNLDRLAVVGKEGG